MIFFSLTFLLLWVSPLVSAQEIPFQIGHTNDILTVKFSPDDRQLISYSAGDGRLCLWEVNSGRLLWVTDTGFIQKANEYYNLREFDWSEDQKFLLTKSENSTYQTWDAKTGRMLSISETKSNLKLLAPNKRPVFFTQDSGKFSMVDAATKEVKEIKRFGNNSALDTSNDGTLLAEGGSWGDASIKITQIKTGKSWWLDGHPSVVKTLAYSPDGNYFAVAGSDKNIYIFDAAKRALSKTLVGHTKPVMAIAFSPDGKTLLSIDKHEFLKVWDWQSSNLLQEINSNGGVWGEKKIEFSKDGKHFLTVGDGSLTIWSAQIWQPLQQIKTAETYKETSGDRVIGYSDVPVLTAHFADGGKRVWATHRDGTLRAWDTASGKQLRRFKVGGQAPFLQLSRDAKTILVAVKISDEFQVKIFNAKTGKAVFRFDDEDTSFLEALSLSADGKHFATSNISGEVLLWDVHKQNPIRKLDIGSSSDDALAFSPDGKTLAVGGRNQNLFLFDVETGSKLWQLIPSYQPSELEIRLTKEKEQRQALLREAQAQRDAQAAIDTEVFKKQVYISFAHYGDMTDPGELRMMESDERNKSKVKKSAKDSQAIWLRLHNDSPLPIKIPTQSMYLPNPKCFYEFSGGRKMSGLCNDREISIWFGLEDKNGKPLRYGFDFGSSAFLLPKTSVLFAVPHAILKNGAAIHFALTFQKEADENKIEGYGTAKNLRFRESNLPKATANKE